ncbi:MAG TPA: glycosyltransferase [Capsulimonadaceae bacterium]|jgi:glycosyltransferase involved in cell wall biosynthesis
MTDHPSIAIIVPVYNGASHVEATLASALAQDGVDVNVIVVDDGSSDTSRDVVAAIAAADARVVMHAQANAGIAGARNAGLSLLPSAAEYVLFLDHDDLLLPGSLAKLVATLNAHPNAPAAHGESIVIDAGGETVPQDAANAPPSVARRRLAGTGLRAALRRALACAVDEPTAFAALIYSNPIRTMGQVLFRRAALDKAGPFDASMVPVDDLDMYVRVALQAPLAYVPEPVAAWRMHDGNTSRRVEVMYDARERFLDKLIAMELPAAERDALRTLTLYRVVVSTKDALSSDSAAGRNARLGKHVAQALAAYR